MNGQQILQKVRDTYLNFKSYVDSGTVRTIPATGKGPPTQFSTYFHRPGKVRFEWRMWHPNQDASEPPLESSVVTADGKRSRTRFLNLNEEMELSSALAAATGVSSSSILMIIKLLIPECVSTNPLWYEMRDVKLVDEEMVNNFSCFHIVGTNRIEDDTEAWVSKDDFIVRRLRWKKGHVERSYCHEYDYSSVNIDVPPSDQLFDTSVSK